MFRCSALIHLRAHAKIMITVVYVEAYIAILIYSLHLDVPEGCGAYEKDIKDIVAAAELQCQQKPIILRLQSANCSSRVSLSF